MDDVAIPAVRDLQERRLDVVEETLVDAGRPAPERYDDHETMLANTDLDGVVIAPSWRYHVPVARTVSTSGPCCEDGAGASAFGRMIGGPRMSVHPTPVGGPHGSGEDSATGCPGGRQGGV